MRLLPEQRVRANKWCKFERILDDGNREVRYIREIIYGKKRALRYWEITTDIETLPENSTWYVMTQIPGVLAKEVGNLYGNRTWIEYNLRQSIVVSNKNETLSCTISANNLIKRCGRMRIHYSSL